MKAFYPKIQFILGFSLLLFFNPSNAQQCKMSINSLKGDICFGDSTELFVNVGDTLTTTFNDDNSQRGNMFTVIAKNDITITHFEAHPENDTKYAVYYKTGTYVGSERDSTKWNLLGRHYNVKTNGNGNPTLIPIYFKVDVDKGDSVSFYVSSTTTVVQNYTNGSYQHNIFAQDANLIFREGCGLDWPFTDAAITGIFAPRVFNGRIHYQMQGKRTVKWSTNETTDTIKIKPTKNTTYFVDVTQGACTMKDSFRVRVENLNVNLGNDTTLCDGNSIQLDASQGPTGTVYAWKPGGGDKRYKLITTGGEKTVTVTTPTGCRYRDTIFLTAKSSPQVSLGSDIDLCDGDSIDLDPGDFGALAKYEWNTSDSTRSINTNTAGRYVVTVTDSFGCIGKDNVDITLRKNPEIRLGDDKEVCENDSITLDAEYAGNGSKYLWNTNEETKTIIVTKTGGYRVDVTSEYGCKGSDSIYYFFHGKPQSGMNLDQEACKGDEITLDAGTHGPDTKYKWSTNVETRKIKVTQNGEYEVLITDSFGCKNLETISLNFRKLPKVNLGLDLNFCDGNTEVLDAGFDDGYTQYEWNNSETSKTLEVGTSGTYSVVVTDSFGCTNTDEVDVLVLSLPEFDWKGDTAICKGETVELDPGNHDKYKWSTDEKTRTITIGEGTYSVVITNVFGCQNEDTIDVSTVPDATASFTSNDLGGQKVEFTNNSTSADSHKWEFGDGNSSTEMSPTHWYKTEGDYTVTLTASNRCGENETTENVNIEASSIFNTTASMAKIYPNPSKGQLFLELINKGEQIDIVITDLSGKLIPITYQLHSENTWSISLPNHIGTGMYICTVKTNNELITQPFMVE